MDIQLVSYSKTFPLQGYSNERIGVEFKLTRGEDPLQAFADAKKLVEKSHLFFQQLPDYDRAKKIIANPDDYTGRDVKAAEESINAFELNYPDYLQKFSNITREITAGERKDYLYPDNED